MRISFASLFELLRPKQWIKNAFVCAGVIFGARLRDPAAVEAMLLAVVAFSLMGSCVYVFNDYLDRESDRSHPTKKNRPLASGVVTPRQALAAGIACLLGSTVAAWVAEPRVMLVVFVYLTVNVLYSVRLKHVAVVDVFCIASGFMLRIMAGTWGIRISPTGWLILTGMFLTLFLGFAKRRAEWIEAAGDGARRRVLTQYSQPLLDSFLSISATGTVICYGLYTLDSHTIELHHTDKLIYTMPFVLFGLFRYLLLLHGRNKGENPSEDVFTDPQILICGAAYVATASWLLLR